MFGGLEGLVCFAGEAFAEECVDKGLEDIEEEVAAAVWADGGEESAVEAECFVGLAGIGEFEDALGAFGDAEVGALVFVLRDDLAGDLVGLGVLAELSFEVGYLGEVVGPDVAVVCEGFCGALVDGDLGGDGCL